MNYQVAFSRNNNHDTSSSMSNQGREAFVDPRDFDMSSTTLFILSSLGATIGSVLIVNPIISSELTSNAALTNDQKREIKRQKYAKFTLGCTLTAVGLNFFSYYYYPYNTRNRKVSLDPIRRSGLWALFGCFIGLAIGNPLFL